MVTSFLVAAHVAAASAIAPVALVAGPDRGFDIAVPTALRYEPEMSKTLTIDLLDNRHYDGTPVDVGADAHVGTDIALYVIWVHASKPSIQPSLTVRRTFDEIRAAPFRATDRIKAAEFVSWNEDVSDELATATFEWMHRSNETRTLVRVAMWATEDGKVRQVRAECVMHADSLATTRPLCEGALASMTVTAPRGPLGTIESAGTIALSDPADVSDEDSADGIPAAQPAATTPPTTPPNTPPTMGPTQHRVVYRQAPDARAKRRNDAGNKLLYLGGGILLAVAVYLATRNMGKVDDSDSDSERSPAAPDGEE